MARETAVGINDDFSSGQSRVADGTADNESSGGIDENLCINKHIRRDNGLDNIFDHILADLLERNVGIVLCGNDYGVNILCLAVLIFHGYLGFAVGTEIRKCAVLSDLCKLLCEPVSQRYGQRHKLGGLGAGKAEHHTLIARADLIERVVLAVLVLVAFVYAHSDIRGLLIKRSEHRAALRVEAVGGVVVADVVDHLAGDRAEIDLCCGGDLAHNVDDAGGHGGFAGDVRAAVLSENAVEHSVGNFIADLVGMSLGNGFGCKQIFSHTIISQKNYALRPKGVQKYSSFGKYRRI